MKIYLAMAVVLLLASCNRDKLSNRDYWGLKSSKINFPKSMEVYDGENMAVMKKPYKLLVYRDSNACTPCYVKSLDDWDEFLSAFKTDVMDVVFVLSPKQEEYVSVKSVLKGKKYKKLIFVDKEGLFMRSNAQIPDDDIYHCMLLDRTNQVQIIGNPLKNETVFKMIVERVYKQ